MKTLSRQMPKEIEHKDTLFGKVILTVLLLGLAWLCFKYPITILIIGTLALVCWVSSKLEAKRLSKIAAERLDEGICTFARSFDCHEIDTWIIRAVYEELQKHLAKADFPIKASDRIDEDLRIDRDDLDDIAVVIAQRAGYSLGDTELNPYYVKVETVEDIVMFFHGQQQNRSNHH